MRRAMIAVLAAGLVSLAACALLPPADKGYVICNESGNETDCGDPVNVTVE